MAVGQRPHFKRGVLIKGARTSAPNAWSDGFLRAAGPLRHVRCKYADHGTRI